MAYTVKLIKSLPDNVESDTKTYLDGASITTMHSITSFRYGNFVYVLIVYE